MLPLAAILQSLKKFKLSIVSLSSLPIYIDHLIRHALIRWEIGKEGFGCSIQTGTALADLSLLFKQVISEYLTRIKTAAYRP